MLLEHYEQPLQFIPLVLIVAAVAAIVPQAMSHDAASLRELEIISAVRGGGLRIAAHFRGSAEFQLDLNPSMTAWELEEKVMRAKAPPLLAPRMMLQMGLLGLAYVYSDVRYRARIQRVQIEAGEGVRCRDDIAPIRLRRRPRPAFPDDAGAYPGRV